MRIPEMLNRKPINPITATKGWWIFLKKMHPLEILLLLILPSPSWPFYFLYKEDIKIKYKKILKRCKKHKDQQSYTTL
jgi:hypothetical protein